MTDILSRREMEERLANGPANDYMELAATTKQLAEWLEMQANCYNIWGKACRLPACPQVDNCDENEHPWPCEAMEAEALVWLEGKPDGG